MIMVIVDYFTKMKIFIPTTTKVTVLEAAELFKNNVFKRFGIPKGIVSDRGTQFVLEFNKELWKLLGIKGMPSTAYHPQTNGQTERVNQELEVYLRFYINYQQDDWSRWLDQAEFIQNSNFHEAIQNTPFELMHGFTPWSGREEGNLDKSPGANEWKTKLMEARKRAQEALENVRASMKKHYDKKKEKGRDFEEGEKVWLDAKNLKTYQPGKKLDNKKLGPFTILEKVGM